MNTLASQCISRAQGCLLGQLAGDALGGLVEFQTPEDIRRQYPNGVRDLADGGTWNTLASQPTDDSEMALVLARMLIEQGTYDAEHSRKAYLFWLNSDPFDCGSTVSAGLRGRPNLNSQANGALMRICPLGIFGVNYDLAQVAEWARQDAAICGALLGAVHGREAIPARWIDKLLQCCPEEGKPRVFRPRPKCFWPVDALELAERLLQ